MQLVGALILISGSCARSGPLDKQEHGAQRVYLHRAPPHDGSGTLLISDVTVMRETT